MPPANFYTLEEMKQKIELDSTHCKSEKEKIQTELIMIKQLLRNVQKNKLNVIRDYYEHDKLSIQRKLAIKSIKSKVEEQSRKIAKNEMVITDQLAILRRKEKLLGQC